MSGSLHLVAFLPNVHLDAERVISVGPLTLCSPDADVMRELVASAGNDTGLKMLQRFRTTFGQPLVPTCLLSASDHVDATQVRDFRNLTAISAVVGGTASSLAGGQWLVTHSDHFALFHYGPGRNGWLVTLEGLSTNMTDEIDSFTGGSVASVTDPAHFDCRLDEPLLGTLVWAWKARHERRRHVRRLRRLFRSLEVAFHASQFPSDGLTTVNDVGTRLGLWVSAFEILLRPSVGKVDKVVVQRAIASASWFRSEMVRRRFRIVEHNKLARVSLPVKLYDRLYHARNTFMHGNSIVGKPLQWHRGDRPVGLDGVAACLFGAALRAALTDIAPTPGPYDEMLGLDLIEKAFLPTD
jgi:hypothetical protein